MPEFNPTDPAHYSWWRNALHKSQQRVQFSVPVDDPQCGYYKYRTNAREAYRPVAIWYKRDGTMTAKVADEKADPLKIWRFCAANPISNEDYKTGLANGFPAPIGDNKPPEGTEQTKAQIESLLEEARAWIKSLPGDAHQIATQDQADYADSLVKSLRKARKAAEDTFKAEQQPHKDALEDVKAAWNPCLEAAKKAIDTILARATIFLSAQKAKAAQVETETGLEVEKPKASGGTGGRSTHLRKFTEAEVVEPEKAVIHYCNNEKVLEIVQRLAVAEFKATGKEPPGVKIKETEKAV